MPPFSPGANAVTKTSGPAAAAGRGDHGEGNHGKGKTSGLPVAGRARRGDYRLGLVSAVPHPPSIADVFGDYSLLGLAVPIAGDSSVGDGPPAPLSGRCP